MKLKILFVIACIFIGATSAHAQKFGWRGSVTFTDGANNTIVNFSGPTYADCEAQRSFTKSLYSPPTYSVVSESMCFPIFFVPEKLYHIYDFKRPFPFPFPDPDPVCLSCPYLTKDFLELIYPENLDRVIKVMDTYRIKEYNEALKDLNAQYDLDGFNEDMYRIDQNIDQRVRR